MCVEIVMMILMMMMISAKDIPRVLGAHKVTKRVRKEKNLSSLCPLPHETTSNQQKMEETQKKTCEKKREKKERQHSPSSTFGLKAWDSKTKSEKKNAFFLLLPSSYY